MRTNSQVSMDCQVSAGTVCQCHSEGCSPPSWYNSEPRLLSAAHSASTAAAWASWHPQPMLTSCIWKLTSGAWLRSTWYGGSSALPHHTYLQLQELGLLTLGWLCRSSSWTLAKHPSASKAGQHLGLAPQDPVSLPPHTTLASSLSCSPAPRAFNSTSILPCTSRSPQTVP